MGDRTKTPATTAAGDAARLAALQSYRVLDTPAEQGFDDIVTLATQLCDTPVALVSLVDRERQWFKARVGFEPCETDLDSSVCSHALGRTEILQIKDLTKDPLTVANPLVTGAPFIRFYAGAPLTTADGLTLGTLCVIDKTPRPGGLTAAQRVGLRALANQVMSQLDLRRAVAERDAAMEEREAGRALALAEAARLEAMIATQQAVASTEADLGAVFQAVVDGALRVVDAADGAVVELRNGDDLVYDTVSGTSARHKGIRLPISRTLSGKALLAERPMACADTETDPSMNHALAIGLGIRSMVVVPVTRRGEPVGVLKVQSGKPDAFSPRDVVMTQMLAGLVASAFGDVAEVKSQRALRRAEIRYRQTFESVTEFGVVVTDRDGTVTEWNTGAERIFGWTADEMRGVDAERFFTPEDRAIDRAGTEMATSLREGRAIDERWHLREDGSRFYASGNMMPLRDDVGAHLGFIKIVRDRTDQHLAGLALDRSRQDLEASEAKWRGLFENLQEGFILGQVIRAADGRIADWRYEEVNRAWGELVGIPSSQAAGRTIRELFPGIEDAWVNEFADVVETGETVRFTRQVGALGRWYDGVCQPAGGDRFAVIFLEVTQRVRAERLREALAEIGARLLELTDPDEMSATVSAIVGRTLGVGRVGYGSVAEDGETFVVPSDWTRDGFPSLAGTYRMSEYGAYAADLRRGRTVVIPDIRLDPRTSADTGPLEGVGVRTLVNHPVVENGRTVAVFYVNDAGPRDWLGDEVDFLVEAASRTRGAVERRQAELLLREADERYRAFVENVQVGFCIIEIVHDADGRPVDYRFLDANPALEHQTGLAGVVGRTVRELAPEFEQHWIDLYDRVAQTGEPAYVQQGSDVLGRWFDVHAIRIGGPDEGRVAVLFSDITERKRAEEQRAVLNSELAHRLKNTLALVQSIATQTLRTAPDMATARKALTDRICALSKAHDVLLVGQRDAGGIRTIVGNAVALHDPGGRVRLSGPDVEIGPKAALTLSLIVHELGTNAVKYGALSVDTGVVDVDWSVDIDPETRRANLTFEWREVGGPPVTPPERRSFGTRLIEMGLSGAAESRSELDYDPSGLRCRITASLLELQTDDA